MPGRLCIAFLEALCAEQRDRFAAVDDLEESLAVMVATGLAAWPDVSVAPEAVVGQLAAALSPDLDAEPLEIIAGVRAGDLYLACACAAGDGRALAVLERSGLGEVDVAVHRLGGPPSMVDEVRQVVREEILVARDGRRPGIARFSGRGDLRSWIRVTAMRHAMRVLRAGRRHQELEDGALYDLLAPVDDPEVQHLKLRYREQFNAAFRDAIGALDAKQRSVLRYQAIEGLTIDEVGAIYGVHRATAARWVAGAREDLLAHTRKILMKRLGVGRSEVDSILRLVQSRMDVSLERLLAATRRS